MSQQKHTQGYARHFVGPPPSIVLIFIFEYPYVNPMKYFCLFVKLLRQLFWLAKAHQVQFTNLEIVLFNFSQQSLSSNIPDFQESQGSKIPV